MKRRTLLSAMGAGALTLAGCSSTADDSTDSGTEPSDGESTTTPTDLPAACPTSADLGVSWPGELNESTVTSFVEAYEEEYYKRRVVEYEPESRLDEYSLSGSVTNVQKTGDGWTAEFSGSGAVYHPTLVFSAERVRKPTDEQPIDASTVQDATVSKLLTTAANTGSAEKRIQEQGETVEQYLQRFETLDEDFEIADRNDSDTLLVDVDGTIVELTVEATNFHGDYWWGARYYVDEHVLRRAEGEETDPQNGTLLECRTDG